MSTGVINKEMTLEEVKDLIDGFIVGFMEDKTVKLAGVSLEMFQNYFLDILNGLIVHYVESAVVYTIPNKFRPYALVYMIKEFSEYVTQRILFFVSTGGMSNTKYSPVSVEDIMGEVLTDKDLQQGIEDADFYDVLDDSDDYDPDIDEIEELPEIDVSEYYDPLHGMTIPENLE